jgi:hypothetical protein
VGRQGQIRPRIGLSFSFFIYFSLSLFPSLNLNSNLYGSTLKLIFVKLGVLILDIFIYTLFIFSKSFSLYFSSLPFFSFFQTQFQL